MNMLAQLNPGAILGAIALCMSVGTARPAAAQEPVKGEVLVVLAREAAGPVDPKLKEIAALQQAPFNSFGSMELLATHAIELTADKPASVDLPNGRNLRVALVERMPDGRHKLQVSINRPDKKDYLPLLTVIASDEPFFVAGQRHAGGTLVIGVKVGKPAAKPAKKPASK
jgi:hypothetical protein